MFLENHNATVQTDYDVTRQMRRPVWSDYSSGVTVSSVKDYNSTCQPQTAFAINKAVDKHIEAKFEVELVSLNSQSCFVPGQSRRARPALGRFEQVQENLAKSTPAKQLTPVVPMSRPSSANTSKHRLWSNLGDNFIAVTMHLDEQ